MVLDRILTAKRMLRYTQDIALKSTLWIQNCLANIQEFQLHNIDLQKRLHAEIRTVLITAGMPCTHAQYTHRMCLCWFSKGSAVAEVSYL